MDIGRKFDLEELYKMRNEAPNAYWRDQCEAQMAKILRENPQIRESREELIRAVRNKDQRHVHYVQAKINYLRQSETGGREIS